MKKKLFNIIFFLICSLSYTNEIKSFFSIGTRVGLAIRNIDEYIYSAYDDHMVSRLEYKAYLAQVNFDLDYTINNWRFSTNINSVLPLKCGTFNDYDFTETGITKNLCFFDNYCTGNIGITFSVDYKFPLNSMFYICPCLQFEYNYDSFIGKNGWGYFGTRQYSKNGQDVSWDSEYARKAKRVSAISFKTNNLFFFTGFFFGINLNETCKFQLGTFIAPFCSTLSYDHHYDETNSGGDYELTETQTSNFMNFKECLDVDIYLLKNLFLSLNIDCTFRPIIMGTIEDSYQQSGNKIMFCSFEIGMKILINQ